MTLVQSQTDIRVETGNSGASRTESRQIIYPFDKESVRETDNANGKITLKLNAESKGKGKLILNTQQKVKSVGDEASINIKEVLELSKDGKTLKVTREINNSKGLPVIEIFVAGKQLDGSSMTNESAGAIDAKDIPAINKKISQGMLNGIAKHLENPDYPAGARANRVSGLVPVRVIFDEEGKVIFAQAILGHPALKSSAVEAAMKTTFEPVKFNEKFIKVGGTIVYNFLL